MAQVKVKFKKGGSAYGYGYLAGDEGTISKDHLEKLQAAGVVEVLAEKKPTKAEKEAAGKAEAEKAAGQLAEETAEDATEEATEEAAEEETQG